MEDKEFTPQGVSPEPEPVQPAEEIAAEAVAAEVPVEETVEAEVPAISVDELMGTRDAALEDRACRGLPGRRAGQRQSWRPSSMWPTNR